MNHCIEKIRELIEAGRDDRRSIFQVGYNLGRLAELTRLGRLEFWDRWKEPVANWNLVELRQLAQELLRFVTFPTLPESSESPPPEETSVPK